MPNEPQKPSKERPCVKREVQSEETILKDKCMADFCLKGGSGLIIGGVITLFFTRPQTYPMWLGLGFGCGMAYDCCQARWNRSI
ncbi:hypothetical protein KR032_005570 [Drosophila birchii]|nr:hypothetical protein KR032_005570 [Drosophila birchii]